MKREWRVDDPLSCPMLAVLNAIGGKWKPMILHMLASGIMRFGDIKRNIPPIRQKVLTQQLRELESDGIVRREVYAEIPPRVEYSLTPRGASLVPILDDLYEWGKRYGFAASGRTA